MQEAPLGTSRRVRRRERSNCGLPHQKVNPLSQRLIYLQAHWMLRAIAIMAPKGMATLTVSLVSVPVVAAGVVVLVAIAERASTVKKKRIAIMRFMFLKDSAKSLTTYFAVTGPRTE